MQAYASFVTHAALLPLVFPTLALEGSLGDHFCKHAKVTRALASGAKNKHKNTVRTVIKFTAKLQRSILISLSNSASHSAAGSFDMTNLSNAAECLSDSPVLSGCGRPSLAYVAL